MEPMLPNPNSTAPKTASGQSEINNGFAVEQSVAANPEQSNTPPAALPSLQDDSVQDDSITTLQSDDATQASVMHTDDPTMADDVDVIEKEWVNKAKKIVASTKDNPHQQEKEVSKLQSDYLMKRYGKQIKASE